MRSVVRQRPYRPAVPLAIALGLLVAAPAASAADPISGKLSAPGYTVIALAKNGDSRSDRAPDGKFKLKPPAKKVTLHLRSAEGTYSGPIVVGTEKHGKRAILGVKAGAKLKQVKLKAADGYAEAGGLKRKSADRKRQARAEKGVPIGAGNFGLVKSKKTDGGAPGDLDLDGVADPLDIDDDGDLILDEYDRKSPRASGATVAAPRETFPDGGHLKLATRLAAPATAAVNVNGGSSDAQIAASEQGWGQLGINFIGIDEGSAELDCGALVYCSPGGTGHVATADITVPPSESPVFPECCDPDDDGFGTLTGDDPGGVEQSAFLWHGATTEQIRAGDVLIMRATVDGKKSEFAAALGFVFSTFPVIASYDDGQGNTGSFSYPRPPASLPTPIDAGPGGDVGLKLRLWRPQRPRIESEPGDAEWMDVGGLSYVAQVGSPSGGSFCPQSSFSTTDPNLVPVSSPPIPGKGAGGFEDLTGDKAADSANELAFSLDLTGCLAANGASLAPGQTAVVTVWAVAVGRPGVSPISSAFSISRFVLQP
jgi:hypothetical protein